MYNSPYQEILNNAETPSNSDIFRSNLSVLKSGSNETRDSMARGKNNYSFVDMSRSVKEEKVPQHSLRNFSAKNYENLRREYLGLKERFHERNNLQAQRDKCKEVTFQNVNNFGSESYTPDEKSLGFEQYRREMNKIKHENLREFNKCSRIKVLGIDKFEPPIKTPDYSSLKAGKFTKKKSARRPFSGDCAFKEAKCLKEAGAPREACSCSRKCSKEKASSKEWPSLEKLMKKMRVKGVKPGLFLGLIERHLRKCPEFWEDAEAIFH